MSFTNTFQKNKRFWMAAVLMICIVSFVFCGMPQVNEHIMGIFGRRGDTVARIGGKNVTNKDLAALKTQREMADHLMKYCVNEVFNRISKVLADEQKKQVPEKELPRRQQELTRLAELQRSLANRKSRPFYFESGRKFDELTEFMLWQAQADELGIHLEPAHIDYLFQMEFYNRTNSPNPPWLSDQELAGAEFDVRRNFHNTNRTAILHAIGEEFRVKIAQYAVMQAQPYSFFSRGKRQEEGFVLKFTEPEVPDEIRAPMTWATLWDVYKEQRAEFDVTLVPIHVQDFVKKVADPTESDRAAYFAANNKPFDPTSPSKGVEVPSRIQIAYVYADPASPAYLNPAKVKSLLEVTSPMMWSPMESGMVTAARFVAVSEAELKIQLQRQYEALSRSRGERYVAPPIGVGAGLSSMAAWFSHQSPQAAAGLVAGSFPTPGAGVSALGGYVAWGATKHTTEIEAVNRSELAEWKLYYTQMFPISPFNQPLELAAWLHVMGNIRTDLPIAAVQTEIRDMVARRQAEEWARENMHVVKRALEAASGDAEKFKRVLNKVIPEYKLTYGPAGEAKDKYLHRYALDTAEELKPLHDSFLKYVDMINFFEGRDITPERLLRPTDFYKMFFDSAEHFSASTQYRAMPWPPVVAPNKARAWKKPNLRLINKDNINPDVNRDFAQAMVQNDPRLDPPHFDLFNNAEKPILFWRVSETEPVRPGDYKKIDEDLKTIRESQKEIERDMIKAGQKPAELAILKDRANKLKFTESDLSTISTKITEGWKFEHARTDWALGKAKEVAEAIIKAPDDLNVLAQQAKALDREMIPLRKVTRMHPERLPNFDTDYFDYPLPKDDQLVYPRDDMAKQVVELYDLKSHIEIKNRDAEKAKKDPFAAELDKMNRDLYNLVKDMKPAQGKYVQILTNKPRTIFYVAVVTNPQKPDEKAFAAALTGAPFERRFARDHFVTRAQQQEARVMRAAMVSYIGDRLGYSIEDKARENFDRVGSD